MMILSNDDKNDMYNDGDKYDDHSDIHDDDNDVYDHYNDVRDDDSNCYDADYDELLRMLYMTLHQQNNFFPGRSKTQMAFIDGKDKIKFFSTDWWNTSEKRI